MRPQDEYAAGHIPGAMGIPVGRLVKRLADGMREGRLADLPVATRS